MPIVPEHGDPKHDGPEHDDPTVSASRLAIAPHGSMPQVLADLPIAALRLDAKALDDLGQLGVKHVEQLAALPRGPGDAFWPRAFARLDEALAATAEVITPCRLPAEFKTDWLFETPTSRQDEIEYVLGELLPRLTGPLAVERRGVLELAGRLDCPPDEPRQMTLRLFRPSVCSRHLLDMFRLRLETIQLRWPVTAIHLAVTAADRLPLEQQTLFALESHQAESWHLAQAIDRLTHRLGREAVLRPLLLADAQPEYACQYLPITQARDEGKSSRTTKNQPPTGRAKKNRAGKSRPSFFTPPPSPVRPTRLYVPPVALHRVAVAADGTPLGFHYQASSQRVVQAWGPERIETGWWRTRLVRRDYYRVETATAERYWLFRCLSENRWFLQGAFD